MRELVAEEIKLVSGGWDNTHDPLNPGWPNDMQDGYPDYSLSSDPEGPDPSIPGPGDGSGTAGDQLQWVLSNPIVAVEEFLTEFAQAAANDADQANSDQAQEWLDGNPMAGSLLGP